jgi:hypothetical protein
VVQLCWVRCQGPDADTIPRRLEPLPKLCTCPWRWAKRKPETCKPKVNKLKTCALCWSLYNSRNVNVYTRCVVKLGSYSSNNWLYTAGPSLFSWHSPVSDKSWSHSNPNFSVFKTFRHQLSFWTSLVHLNPSCITLRYTQIVQLNANPTRDIYEPSQSYILHSNQNAVCSPVLISAFKKIYIYKLNSLNSVVILYQCRKYFPQLWTRTLDSSAGVGGNYSLEFLYRKFIATYHQPLILSSRLYRTFLVHNVYIIWICDLYCLHGL